MKRWQAWLLAALLILLVTAIVLLTTVLSRGHEIALLPAPSPSPVMVYIVGDVIRPGVYTLPWGSRGVDAIQAAGGFKDSADLSSVNLAQKLLDGDRIVVTTEKQPAGARNSKAENKVEPTVHVVSTLQVPLNINVATQEDIEKLPGIGPSKAVLIIAYREKNGGFKSIEEIQNVSTIGKVTYQQIKNLITVK